MHLDPVPQWILLLGLSALWLSAAVHKLRHRVAFQGALAAYRLLPEAALPVLAWVLPGIEFAIGAALLAPATRALAGALGALTLAVYGLAIAINLRRGRRELDCGCLGFGRGSRVSWSLVTRNALLSLACLAAGVLRPAARALDALDVFTVALGVCGACLIYIAAEGLIAAAQRLPGRAHGASHA